VIIGLLCYAFLLKSNITSGSVFGVAGQRI
jgi:hypothetical protein